MRNLLSLLALVPATAAAHPGHGPHEAGGGVAAGIAHPVLGADHLVAMVVLGLLAAALGGRALWALPASFVAAMAAGAGLAFAGLAIPMVEPLILASLVVLGAAVGTALRGPLILWVPVTALFGIAHGAAHGIEAPAGGVVAYWLGFLLMTAVLHAAGVALGFVLARAGTVWTRVAGGGGAALGLSTILLGGA